MPKESDWKHFRAMLEPVRERYLLRRNREFAQQLERTDKSPTECFWQTLDAMQQEANQLERALDRLSRSHMEENLIMMCSMGMLTEEDLEGFSEGLVSQLKIILNRSSK